MAFVSYAQNSEDVLLNRVFAAKTLGFYVDIGAYHPVEGSVTKAFYDRGWSGINVEPGEVFQVLAAARPRDVNLRIAALDRTGDAKFLEHNADHGMSKVVDGQASEIPGLVRTVPCDTLPNIVAKYGQRRPIDFVKIDAEGAEAAIIRTTDWHSLRPTLLVVEATLPWSSQLANRDWEPVLLGQGYQRVYFDGINCFYAPNELPEVTTHFTLPVNVLDGFVRFDPQREALEVRALDAEVAREALEARARDAEVAREALEVRARDAEVAREALEVRALDAEVAREALEARALDAEAARQALEARARDADDELIRLHGDHNALNVQLTETRHRLAELQTESAARVNTLQQDCNALALQADEMRAQLWAAAADRDFLQQRVTILSDRLAVLDTLVRELRWPNGPRALRVTLPIARLVRRLHGTRMADRPREDAVVAPATVPALPISAKSRRSGAKVAVLVVYRMFRPILRPIAWRTRGFLTGQLRGDVAQTQAALQALRQELVSAEARLREDRINAADFSQFGRMLESALLTLALARDAR